MADYITNTEELTSVANAIRNKTGTTSQLTYPAGYISDLASIHRYTTTVSNLTSSLLYTLVVNPSYTPPIIELLLLLVKIATINIANIGFLPSVISWVSSAGDYCSFNILANAALFCDTAFLSVSDLIQNNILTVCASTNATSITIIIA